MVGGPVKVARQLRHDADVGLLRIAGPAANFQLVNELLS
jgi:hypothetical protein